MKLVEIADRLAKEFPDQYAAFDVSIHAHPNGHRSSDMTIYTERGGHIDCLSLEDGIARMHQKLNPNPSEIDIDVAEGGKA